MLGTCRTVINPSLGLTCMGIAGSLPDVVLKGVRELAEIVPPPTNTRQRAQLWKVAENAVAETPRPPSHLMDMAMAPNQWFPFRHIPRELRIAVCNEIGHPFHQISPLFNIQVRYGERLHRASYDPSISLVPDSHIHGKPSTAKRGY